MQSINPFQHILSENNKTCKFNKVRFCYLLANTYETTHNPKDFKRAVISPPHRNDFIIFEL